MSHHQNDNPRSGSTGIPADIVFLNGTIFTAERELPWAQALAISGERISFIGSNHDIRHYIGSGTEVIDLKGKAVLPAFRDGHIHPIIGSLDRSGCSLEGLSSADAYLQRIEEYLSHNPDTGFVKGSGWQHNHFPHTGPRKSMLDAIVPDRPVVLKAIDGHSSWVNSYALKLACIDKDTPNPPGGVIERDPISWEPTGTLREWSAMNLVDDKLPKPGLNDRIKAMGHFMKEAASLGLVAVNEAMAKEDELNAYAALDKEGMLSLEVSASLLCEPELGMSQIEKLRHLRKTYRGNLLNADSVKIFLDGVLEGHTAFLLEPYADRSGFYGELLWEKGEYKNMVSALDREGFQVHVHAIGDAAVRLALDSFAAARRINGKRDSRHIIAHADLISRDDITRFHSLGVIANMQPAWFYEDINFSHTTLPTLGIERLDRLYALKSMWEGNAVVSVGSDWPFSGEEATFNPLYALQIGTTRKGINPGSANPFFPEQAVDLSSLIIAHSRNNAFAAFREKDTGSLGNGKYADLIVCDSNIFEIPTSRIASTKVIYTVFHGKVIYNSFPDGH
jgi:predicted amidohydrolase YtcJ